RSRPRKTAAQVRIVRFLNTARRMRVQQALAGYHPATTHRTTHTGPHRAAGTGRAAHGPPPGPASAQRDLARAVDIPAHLGGPRRPAGTGRPGPGPRPWPASAEAGLARAVDIPAHVGDQRLAGVELERVADPGHGIARHVLAVQVQTVTVQGVRLPRALLPLE